MSWSLNGFVQCEDVIKKSVFRAFATPVAEREDMKTFLEQVSDPEARHNCWAFKIGDVFLSSDDGEPTGTAGRPILSAIENQDFDNVAIVVVRYFGGIKLGAGGLIRAYGGVANRLLRESEKIRHIPCVRAEFSCPLSRYAHVQAYLTRQNAEIVNANFNSADAVELTLNVPQEKAQETEDFLRDLTAGKALLRFI